MKVFWIISKIGIVIVSPLAVGFTGCVFTEFFHQFIIEPGKFFLFIIIFPVSILFGLMNWLNLYRHRFGSLVVVITFSLASLIFFALICYLLKQA